MQLSDRQQQTIAMALTILAAVVIVTAVLGLFWVLAIFLRTFSQVFLPLAVAGIAALVCQPYYEWLRERLRLPVPLAVAALFLSALVPVSLFVVFFGSVIVDELVNFCAQLPIWWNQLLAQIEQHWPEVRAFFTEHPWGQRLTQALEGMGPMLAAGLEHFATTLHSSGNGDRWLDNHGAELGRRPGLLRILSHHAAQRHFSIGQLLAVPEGGDAARRCLPRA